MSKVRDYLFSRHDAVILANRIEAFWRSKGHPNVATTVERSKTLEPYFSIRSNLVNGVPSHG